MTIQRILVAHNHYLSGAGSGEDVVFRNEVQLLREAGVAVTTYEKFNDHIANQRLGKLNASKASLGLARVYSELHELIAKHRPQLVHFHNTFPLIGPAALIACKRARVPVVQTLHNYRWRCAAGILRREGAICERCWTGSAVSAVRFGCYQESRLASLIAVASQWRVRKLVQSQRLVSRYVVLTDFARRKLAEGGVPPELMVVKGNCVATDPGSGDGLGKFVMFGGRIGPEKGVHTLLDAWAILGGSAPQLRLFGQGPLLSDVRIRVEKEGLNVLVMGSRPKDEVISAMKSAALLVVPSEWYEGFPMVIAEALACGTPILASRIGGLPEMIEDGKTGGLFCAGDSSDLARRVLTMTSSPALGAEFRTAARLSYEQRYSATRTLEVLMRIYDSVVRSTNA